MKSKSSDKAPGPMKKAMGGMMPMKKAKGGYMGMKKGKDASCGKSGKK